MKRSRTSWLPAMLLVGLTTVAFAQQDKEAAAVPATPDTTAPAQQEPTTSAATDGQPQEQGAATADEAQKKAQEAQKKAERLQKIQQLAFDRRPSAILKAWSGGTESNAPASEVSSPDQSAPQPPPPDPFDAGLATFKKDVTLGNWTGVKQFLAGLPEDEGKAAYKQLLQSLQSGAPPPAADQNPAAQRMQQMAQLMAMQQGQQFLETNSFSLGDLLKLADAAPCKLEDEHLTGLAGVLRLALDKGNLVDQFVILLRQETAKPEAEAPLTSREAAKLLMAAGHPTLVGEFLPDLETAQANQDHEALNLLSRYHLGLHAQEAKIEHLEEAWRVTQAVLASEKIESKQKDEALRRAVELAPKIRDELGQVWLDESFTEEPQRGMEILATIGTGASTAMQTYAFDSKFRWQRLQLQTTAVEALLKSSPDLAAQWSETLNLLAQNWLQEGGFSYQFDQSTSLGPRLRRDVYGNFFYYDESSYMPMHGQPNQPQAIKTGDLLEIKPSERWIALLREGLKPKFDMIFAQLYLKVGEEDLAFPYVERLATLHPERGKDLVDEFLRVWTRNHDPNADRNRTNPYMYMYGFERRAESIPLTRSKQERNLTELAALVKRLEALPLGRLNEELLAKAFTTCHSSAEVYRLEAIEKVFGALEDLEPKTLAELAQQMRANLVGVWRQPAVQEDKKTRRKQKDIQAEVLRGYRVARSVVEDALKKHPGDWSLQLASACLEHDENNYRREIATSSEFSQRRDDAFQDFQEAARLYAERVGSLTEDEQTAKAYELWFYASLGACDLEHVDEKKSYDLRQPQLIREAILSLPGEAAERHLSMFANALFTRMSAAKPAVKVRYLKAGFEIAGDHKQAHEARQVYNYYNDLVTEIKLETVVDGSDVVGHTQPFGVFVNLRHTREIERESGGFGRYLQNQNSGTYFYYNYGRPLENYRDKFEELVRQALGEHFEVLSLTFQSEDVNSKAVEEYGWRVTPYAYLLLKARGPQVDKIPPLVLNLDFLDTSGYVILPIESPAVAIDASPKSAGPRPIQDLAITQILDERRADEGKLVLEVKAVGHGLVPELNHILDFRPAGFEIVETLDQGVSVSKFDPESDETLVLSERTWMISMQAAQGDAPRPTVFRFGSPKLETAEVTRQRYVDADLLEVAEEVSLEERYGQPSYAWGWIAAAAVVVGVLLLLAVRALVRRPRRREQPRFELPAQMTPFTVLGLLKQIQQNNGLGDADQSELSTSIGSLERYYFASTDGDEPDLTAIAETWVRRATPAER